jgi:adenosine deaminase
MAVPVSTRVASRAGLRESSRTVHATPHRWRLVLCPAASAQSIERQSGRSLAGHYQRNLDKGLADYRGHRQNVLVAVGPADANPTNNARGTMPMLDTLITRLPKCEMHIHIEGSLEPELMFALASRNRISLPYASVEALRQAYQFSNLQDFLDIYYQGMSVLITEQDFYDLAWSYLERARADNLVHVEMFFDPQGHTARGVEFSTVINGLHRAIVDARQTLGVRASLIMCFLRHLDEADAEKTLDAALAFKDRIVGVGLDSSETGHPPSKFKRVFNRARDAGFFLSAHAGEEGPPSYIWEALDVLGVARIDHGIRSMEDEVLVGRLAREKTALTVCPLSNLRLRVVDDLAHHPLRRMLDKGLMVTVNSDDPAYFGGYVNQNYRAVSDALGLCRDEIVTIVRNGVRASLMTPSEKDEAFAEIDRILATIA